MTNNKLTNNQCGICADCAPQINGGSGFNNCAEAHAAQTAGDKAAMNNKLTGLRYGHNAQYLLSELASYDADDIDGDEFEVYGEDSNGREGSATISITELAADAAKLLTAKDAELQEYRSVAPEDYFASLVTAARIRADKAMLKFPQPNYVLNKVAEEGGEVIKAVIHFTEGREQWENVEAELIDNLAMLIRLVKEGDQVIGFTPPEACRAAMQSGAVKDGWVACSERMPETMVSVLVTGEWFNYAIAFWDGHDWCDLDYEPPVTHWQPLPAAPDFREIGNSSTKHFRENSETSTNHSRDHFISLCNQFWNWQEFDEINAGEEEPRLEWDGKEFTHRVTQALWRMYQAAAPHQEA